MSEEPTPDSSEPKKLTIQGQIRQADGRPLSDVVVRAFDKEMRSEERLREVTTGKDGRYKIKYAACQLASLGCRLPVIADISRRSNTIRQKS